MSSLDSRGMLRNPTKADRPFGLLDNFITHQKNYGRGSETDNGVDVTVSARLRHGLAIQGGTSSDRSAFDNCEVLAQVPEARTIGPVRQPEAFCDHRTPFHTNLKGLATYTVPH